MKKFVVGIDLGGTKINCAIADLKGNIVNSIITATNSADGETAVLNRIMFCIEKVVLESKINFDDIIAIGIGSPGPIDHDKGIIITTPNLPFKNFNIVKSIKDKYNIDTYLDNDGNVAALGEFIFGAGIGTKNMIYITVSTGIGAGAILNGKIYRGNTANALEIGHMTIDPKGPRCNCGNYGCAEALGSGTAIAKKAKKALKENKETGLAKYDNITSYEVFKEAKNGDCVAKLIVEESLDYLGICVSNIITCFDPELIVIGGGVSKAGKIVFDRIERVVQKRCFANMAQSCKIVSAKLQNNTGVKGAIALALIEKGIKI